MVCLLRTDPGQSLSKAVVTIALSFLSGPQTRDEDHTSPLFQGLAIKSKIELCSRISLGLAETVKYALWYEGFLIHSCISLTPFLVLFLNILVPPILSLRIYFPEKTKHTQISFEFSRK